MRSFAASFGSGLAVSVLLRTCPGGLGWGIPRLGQPWPAPTSCPRPALSRPHVQPWRRGSQDPTAGSPDYPLVPCPPPYNLSKKGRRSPSPAGFGWNSMPGSQALVARCWQSRASLGGGLGTGEGTVGTGACCVSLWQGLRSELGACSLEPALTVGIETEILSSVPVHCTAPSACVLAQDPGECVL